jgi:hypothetical protein
MGYVNQYGNCGTTYYITNPTPPHCARLKTFETNCEYKSITIASRHYFLASCSDNDIDRWNRDQCRVQLRVLENAQNIFEIECRQRMKGQRVITEFFSPDNKET